MCLYIDLDEHEAGHEKSPQWTIEGIQIDFPENFNIAAWKNRFEVYIRGHRGREAPKN